MNTHSEPISTLSPRKSFIFESVRRKWLVLGVLAGVVALLLFVMFFPPTRILMSEAFTSALLPRDIRVATFVTTPDKQTFLQAQLLGFKEVRGPIKPSGITSPNNIFLVYSVSHTGSSTSTVVSHQSDTSSASVLMSVFSDARDPLQVGQGIHPVVLDDTHVLRFTPTGIFVTDVSSGKETRVLNASMPRITEAFLSPSREYLAWVDPIARTTTIASVSKTSLTVLRIIDTPMAHFAVSDEALYEIVPTSQGGELWRYSFTAESEDKKIVTFPAHLHIWNIIL